MCGSTEVPGNSVGADALDDRLRHALAAPAVERETAGERRAEVLVEFRSQQDTRTVQPGFHGLRLQAKEMKDLPCPPNPDPGYRLAC